MSRLVVFDCDGTLVDGQAAICETMELAFTSNGLAAPDRHHVRRMVGLSLPYALRELAPDVSDEQRHAALRPAQRLLLPRHHPKRAELLQNAASADAHAAA